MDKEIETLAKIVLLLERLDEEEIERILTYLDMRYAPVYEDDIEENYSYEDHYGL